MHHRNRLHRQHPTALVVDDRNPESPGEWPEISCDNSFDLLVPVRERRQPRRRCRPGNRLYLLFVMLREEEG
jgi:hypothetical protein